MSTPISQFDLSIANQASAGQPRTRPSKDERMNQLANYLKNRGNCGQESGSILTLSDRKERIKNINNKTEELKKQNVLVDCWCEEVKQCLKQALKQADEEVQNIKQIQQEQQEIEQQISITHKDLESDNAEILILEKEQNTLLQDVKNIEESFDKVDSNLDLLALELKDVPNDLSKIKLDQKKITEKFDELDKSIQHIQVEQKQTEDQIDSLIEENSKEDTVSQIGEQVIKGTANGKEGLCDSIQEKWKNIKNYTHALPSHAWDKMTNVRSKITSTAADIISIQAISTFKLSVRSLYDRARNYINKNTYPVTLVAFGVFAGCFAMLTLRTHPLEILHN